MSEIPDKNSDGTLANSGGSKPTIGLSWCSHAECVRSGPEEVVYELIVPSQSPSPPGTGILSVNLRGASRLAIPDPYAGCLRGPDLSNWPEPEGYKPWLPYAIMDYEQFALSTESNCCDKGGIVLWTPPRPGSNSFKFEVTCSSELTVYLLARRSDPLGEHQVASLGFIKMNPFLEPETSNKKNRIHVQDGTGRLSVEVCYLEKVVPPLEDRDTWRVYGEIGSSGLVYVEKQDTERSYGMKTIPIVNVAPGSEIADSIEHPFIAPLKFAFKSIKGLSLLSPLASGGQLFHHLQRARRFHADWAKFYAAELLCALEYLHDNHIILAYLNAENVLLDSFGHLNLCNPGLFNLDIKDDVRIVSGTSECPAPELIRNQKASRTVDWWALGVILYEMLIGLPPFYHKNADERRLKILDEAPKFPEKLSSTAQDILTKLLDKSPEKRLGANGVSEIKAHAFFHDTNWQELVQRKSTPPFKPRDAETVFWLRTYDRATDSEGEVQRKIKEGTLYEKVVGAGWPRCGWLPIGQVKDRKSDASNKTTSQAEDDGWELVWDPASYQFHFKNRFTNETSPGRLPDDYSRSCLPSASRSSSAPSSADFDLASRSPRCEERNEALAAALKAGYGKQVFTQILGYATDLSLDIPILSYDQPRRYTEEIELCDHHEVRVTPLEWAVEHGRLDLVNLFLDNGADANFTIEPVEGPALFKAVRIGDQKLVESLVQKTNRVSSTRALALAVKQQDIAIVNTLLVNGVQCDFKRVWAVILDNTDLVRMLLASHADANVAYHASNGNFSCGRVIQRAMELEHFEIVQLLLDCGANIGLPHPVWPMPPWPEPVHICEPVDRNVYLKVTAGLKAAAAESRERM
ncbi:hypothetical protein FQN54_006942 [Arachnomyces sp. PD_36]|nr:hypothetical protein FQN54_006942 [Arachnomyces sp. PD_36]